MTNNLLDQNQVLVVPVRDQRNAGGDPRIAAEPPVLGRRLGENLSIQRHTDISSVLTREAQVKQESGKLPKALHSDLRFNQRFAKPDQQFAGGRRLVNFTPNSLKQKSFTLMNHSLTSHYDFIHSSNTKKSK
ncbi:hypothetical protein HAX54_010350 [Datura stramonium]|uniref:Uncharacterized protein n=1 Tax=Datura stramonium TaxID=4076 RepID=A0ABS8RXE5_DATST|nr:hypothetical protein [Datura stramonium]